MPINPRDVLARDSRFTDQRWLLDAVIQTVGPGWDQGRLEYYSAPCGPEQRAAFLALRSTISKFDDFSREFIRVARFFEGRGHSHIEQGHDVSAREDLFAAAIAFGAAQWPIYFGSELNDGLETKKVDCYLKFAQRADHHIEAVEIPYGDRTIPGFLHLPPGVAAGTDADLACVVMVSGMDAFKELTVLASGDRYLSRGIAVLAIDGPGQGSCLPRGIFYDPRTYGEVGVQSYEFAASRPEIGADRVMVWGLSQGSFWATQMAAAEPRYAACAVMYTCFDPHNTMMFATQSPTFRQKFMYMTGTTTFEELSAAVAAMDVRPLSASLTMPYLVIAGEDDPLTDPQQTLDHLNDVPDPKQLLLYTGEDHAPVTRMSGRLGPAHQSFAADWLADRAVNEPLESLHMTVGSTGRVHSRPWSNKQTYTYGAPLGVTALLGDVSTG